MTWPFDWSFALIVPLWTPAEGGLIRQTTLPLPCAKPLESVVGKPEMFAQGTPERQTSARKLWFGGMFDAVTVTG
jgi:hypothetical protein